MDSPNKSFKFNSRNQSFADSTPLGENLNLEPLRMQLERDYEERLEAAKALYEKRLESLSLCARQFSERVSEDEVLQAMKESSVSQQFVNERIQELYEDAMLQEKEGQIQALQEELLSKNTELLNFNHKFTQLEVQFRRTSEEARLKNLEHRCEDSKENKSLRQQVLELQNYISEKSKDDQSAILKKQLNNANAKFQQILEAEQRASAETFESLQKQHKAKAKKFKKKIIQQKETIQELEMEKLNLLQTNDEARKQLENSQYALHGDLKKVKDEWEKRCNELVMESQRKEAEIESRHQLHVLGLQNQYQQLMDQKINEISDEIRQDSISKASYNQLLQERNMLLEQLKSPDKNLQSLDEANLKIGKLEVALEEANKRKTEAEAETKHFKLDIDKYKNGMHELREEVKKLREKQSDGEMTKHFKNFSVKLEEETASHMQTRAKLLQEEGRAQQLAEDIKDYDRRINDLKVQVRDLEDQNMKLNNKLHEYDNALSLGNNERRTLEKQLSKMKSSGLEHKNRAYELFKMKTRSLKADLSKLANSVSSETNLLRKDMNSKVQELLFKSIENGNSIRKSYENRLSTLTDDMSSQWQQKLQGLESSIESQHSSLLNQYKEEYNVSLKKEQQQNEQLRKQVSELKMNMNSIKDEKENLEIKLQKNAAAFDRLQEEVKQETSRIKHMGSQSVDKVKKEYTVKYQEEINKLTMKLSETTNMASEKVITLEEALKSANTEHEIEVSSLKKRYQELLDQAYSDLQTENNKYLKVRQRLREIEDEASKLKYEHEHSIKQFEGKIDSILHTMPPNDFSNKVRELEFRNKELMEQAKERESLKKKFIELQKKIEDQTHKFHSQIALKDREIEELKDIVSRSYVDSLGQVMRAQELDRETQELTRQARKPSRFSAFSNFKD